MIYQHNQLAPLALRSPSSLHLVAGWGHLYELCAHGTCVVALQGGADTMVQHGVVTRVVEAVFLGGDVVARHLSGVRKQGKGKGVGGGGAPCRAAGRDAGAPGKGMVVQEDARGASR